MLHQAALVLKTEIKECLPAILVIGPFAAILAFCLAAINLSIF